MQNKDILVCGDLNLPNVNWSFAPNSNSLAQILVDDIFKSRNFIQNVREGTRQEVQWASACQ